MFLISCNDNSELFWQEIESIENCEEALIRIYAMNDEAYTFITGISSDFEENIKQYIDNSNENIINNFKYWLISQNIENAEKITKICEKILKNEFSHFSEHVLNTKLWFITNTSQILEYLPRRLLCDFADYLIKLTALKQQLSLDLETVSSESDILLITKSNRPKWIRYTKEIL